jgi:hypothetical protein
VQEKPKVEDLLTLARGLELLDEAALAGIEARGRVDSVRMRDGTEEKRWEVREVHPAEAAVTVTSMRGGRPTPPRKVALREIAASSLLALAEPPNGELHPLARAMGLLAQIREGGTGDLRLVRAAYRHVRLELERAQHSGHVSDRVDQRLREIDAEQEKREDQARQDFNWAEEYIRRKDWASAKYLVDGLRSDANPRHWTAFHDAQREEIDRGFALVVSNLSDLELLDHFPGTQIDTKDGVTSIRLNFESVVQLENFRRELGRAWGVLEPAASPHAVTPGGANLRFHLLRGIEETLVRDRPLSLTSPFDPARPITMEFTLYTGATPFFHALDIDGVQVGILSADPTSVAWRDRWRIPEGRFPVEKGEKLPRLDFYGRGRGIAFHAGTDFGDPERWAWPEASHARRHEEWEEDAKKRPLGGVLFAFEPDRHYRVRLVRERGKLSLFVDGQLVVSEEKSEWATRGRGSDADPMVGRGSGRLQVATWTPAAIDDLVVTGVVRKQWR